MKRYTSLLFIPLIAGLLLGCELVNPTKIQNPNLTDESFVGTAGSSTAWVSGLSRQLSITMSAVVVSTEIISDNYFNNQSGANKSFDIPQLLSVDPDVATLQTEVSRLRTMAEYGLTRVGPADAGTTNDQIAEFYFYQGMAHLLTGELFVAFPATAQGPALEPADHFQRAVAAFQNALQQATNAQRLAGYRLALARAYYQLGDRANAVTSAQQVLAASPNLTRFVVFDRTNGLTNGLQTLLFRNAQDDYQPLPRLDFLDPKFSGTSTTFDDSLCVLKAEEAHLILAEAQIAQNQLAEARNQLTALGTLVASRPRRNVNDAGEDRGVGGIRTDYPKTADFRVRASADDSLRTGLVLSRKAGPVSVPIVSGTSVTNAMLSAATTPEQLLELVYLMRQEIFLAEGRRMTDLGIRLPVAQRESLNNLNIDVRFAEAQIPSFIPAGSGMDNFTADNAARTVTLTTNMNRVLVQNRTSPLVLPFH